MLKPITAAGIPSALQKAERYRLLNDSSAAESICLDVLEVEPDNQAALVMLLLAITDQFPTELSDGIQRARDVLPRLSDAYKRAYYEGIVYERRAKAHLLRGGMGATDVASEWYREAMDCYERAEAIRPQGNDEAILRWNTCVRMMEKNQPTHTGEYSFEPSIGE
jgi:hypothetical protein